MADERIKVTVEGDASDLRRALAQSSGDLKAFAHDVDGVRVTTRKLGTDSGQAGRGLQGLDRSLNSINTRFSFTRNAIRALRWPVLITGAGLAAQALAAVAAGAIALGSALGPLSGVLVALPQALTTAAQGISVFQLATSGVGDAVKALTEQQAGAGKAAVDNARQQEAAGERVRGAERQLQQSHRSVRDAQRALTDARREAKRELRDLELSSEEAALSQKRAALTLREAEAEALSVAGDPGASSGERESARLAVEEARLGVRRVADERRRADEDLTRGSKGGGVNQRVGQAEQQLADARRDRADATRELARAQRDFAGAAGGAGAAADKAEQAMAKLSPAARDFVRELVALKPRLDELRAVAGAELFPGASAGLSSAMRNYGAIRTVVAATAGELGGLARKAGELVGSPAFGRDLQTIGLANARSLGLMGDAGLSLGSALRHVLVAGGPFQQWLSTSIADGARHVETMAEQGRESGRLAGFFDHTRMVLERLASITKAVAGGLLEVGRAGGPLGDEMLARIDAAAERWERWTKSVEGRQALRQYFEDARPAILESGRLVSDLTRAFLRLGTQPGLAELIRAVRLQLLPAVEELINAFTSAFGPQLVQALSVAARLLGWAARGLGLLVNNVPGMHLLVTGVTGLGVALLSLKFLGVIRALRTMIALTSTWRAEGAAAAASQVFLGGRGAGAGAGGAGGVVPTVVGAGAGAGAGRRGRPSPTGAGTRTTMSTRDVYGTARGFGYGPAASAGAAAGATAQGLNTGLRTGLAKATPFLKAGLISAVAVGAVTGLSNAFSSDFQDWRSKVQNAVGPMIGQRSKDQEANETAGTAARSIQTGRGEAGQPLRTTQQLLSYQRQYVDLLVKGKAITKQQGDELRRLIQMKIGERRPVQLLEQDLRRLKNVTPQVRDAFRAGLQGVNTQIEQLRGNVGGGVRAIEADVRQNMRLIATNLGRESLAGKDAMTRNIQAAIHAIGQGMANGTISTSQGMKSIHRLMATESLAGKNGIQRNFSAAIDAVHVAMAAGVLDVRTGMKEIRRLTVEQLMSFGYSAKEAAQELKPAGGVARGRRFDGGRDESVPRGANYGRARGGPAANGWVGQEGERGRDEVPLIVGRGEAIVNRTQQQPINQALGFAKQFGQSPYGSLGEVFAGERRAHYMAQGGFAGQEPVEASGGYAGRKLPGGGVSVGIPGMPGEFINNKVLDEALYLIKKYSLLVTDAGATGGHEGSGHLSSWTAMDVVPRGGGWDNVDSAVAEARRMGMNVLYNGVAGHGRGHHAHIELADGALDGLSPEERAAVAAMTGGAGGGAGAVWEAIKAPQAKASSKHGAVGAVAQSALDQATKAANERGEEIAGAMAGPAGGAPGGPVPPGTVRDWLAQALRITGHFSEANLRALYGRAMQESGGNPRAQNNWDSNAKAGIPSKGLLQTIDPTFNSYKLPGYDDIWNPVHNAVAAIRYMLARYKRIVGPGGGGYASGGIVGEMVQAMAQGGFAGGDVRRMSVEDAAPTPAGAAGEPGAQRPAAGVKPPALPKALRELAGEAGLLAGGTGRGLAVDDVAGRGGWWHLQSPAGWNAVLQQTAVGKSGGAKFELGKAAMSLLHGKAGGDWEAAYLGKRRPQAAGRAWQDVAEEAAAATGQFTPTASMTAAVERFGGAFTIDDEQLKAVQAAVDAEVAKVTAIDGEYGVLGRLLSMPTGEQDGEGEDKPAELTSEDISILTAGGAGGEYDEGMEVIDAEITNRKSKLGVLQGGLDMALSAAIAKAQEAATEREERQKLIETYVRNSWRRMEVLRGYVEQLDSPSKEDNAAALSEAAKSDRLRTLETERAELLPIYDRELTADYYSPASVRLRRRMEQLERQIKAEKAQETAKPADNDGEDAKPGEPGAGEGGGESKDEPKLPSVDAAKTRLSSELTYWEETMQTLTGSPTGRSTGGFGSAGSGSTGLGGSFGRAGPARPGAGVTGVAARRAAGPVPVAREGGLLGELATMIEQLAETGKQHAEQLTTTRTVDVPSTLLDIRELEAQGAEGEASEESERDPELRAEIKLNKAKRRRVKGQQRRILEGFQPLLGGRLVGAFQHGGVIPQTGLAYVHRDETIIPDPEGPFANRAAGQQAAQAQGGGGAHVELQIAGDVAPLLKLIDARIDKRAPSVVREQQGRRTRILTGAPGLG